MRILYCNKYDYPFSGTEAYLFDLIERIDQRGHETALFTMDHGAPGAFQGHGYRVPHIDFKRPNTTFLEKAGMATHALYSLSARTAMRKCIADFAPDVAHVRSIYHHLSPSILWELKRQRVPVLYHLNDFKILCPAYNLVAHGEACEACANGAFYHVLTENCYAGSRASAAVLAAEAYLHRWLHTYERCVDLFLAPSEFVRSKLIENCIPAERIEVLSHFQELPGENQVVPDQGYLLYFGRLSQEKGADDLLHAMVRVPHIPLIIAGDGPEHRRLRELAQQLNLTQVLFTGVVNGDKLKRLIAGCSFSIFPSHAYETLGKSILESYAYARPVVASDLGSRHEFVEHNVTGLLYPAGDRSFLADCISFLFDRPDLIEKMGKNARARLKAHHDPEQHIQRLIEIYSRLAFNKTTALSVPSFPTNRDALRIAFIGGRGVVSKYSGIESYYERVGSELAAMGHEVTVYCRNHFTPAIVQHNGMRIRRLPTIRTKHLETLVHTLISTLDAMRSNYDVIHYHCLGPALFSFLPRLVGKKTVVTVQGLDWQRAKWGRIAAMVLHLGELAAVALPNATMVVSKTLQSYYRDHYSRETIYVPNGACPATRFDRPRLTASAQMIARGLASDQYALFLGRLSPEKNCHLLIEAFEELRTDKKLVLAGGSSHSDSYVESLRRHESDRIRFLPWVSGRDLEELLSNAAVFVLPSEMEGLSLALLDAMAAGVCVLTSDIPENRELVEGTGFTFQRGDVEDLEDMLDLLLRNPELRKQAGVRERERVQTEYLWPKIAKSVERVYRNVLGWDEDKRANAAAETARPSLSTSISVKQS